MTNIQYELVPIRECGERLLDLSKFSFDLDPAYFKAGLSPNSKLYAREQVVSKLLKLQEQLKGIRFKIWDPWRSRVTQEKLYQRYWDELACINPGWDEATLRIEVGKFVTSPRTSHRIPPHATGGAIDLTLVGPDGKELDMGTGFDHFGPESAPAYFEQRGRCTTIRDNRRLLRDAMLSADFRQDNEEWWHFDFGNQLWAAEKEKPFAIYGEVKPE